MFVQAVAFTKDLSGWNVVNGQNFVNARRIQLVSYDAYYNSQLLYCIIYISICCRDICFIGQLLLTKI